MDAKTNGALVDVLDGLVDRVAEAIRDGDGLVEGDRPWAILGEERRAPWRADARRALAVVKESLTAELANEAAFSKLIEAAKHVDALGIQSIAHLLLRAALKDIRAGESGQETVGREKSGNSGKLPEALAALTPESTP